MKIAIESKAKNGLLLSILRERGWRQADLARAAGVCPAEASRLALLKFREISETALEKMAAALSVLPEDLVPPDLRRWSPEKPLVRVAEVEVPVSVLLSEGVQVPLLAESNVDLDKVAVKDEVEYLLNETPLSSRDRRVVKMRFGIGYEREHTLASVGKQIGCTRERVRMIEAKALTKMREQAERTPGRHLGPAS